MFALSDYHYHLDEDLIAQEAIHPHHDARLMVVDKNTGNIEAETTFWHLDSYLEKNTVLFFNDSKVIRSRVAIKNTPFLKWIEENILKEWEIFFLEKQEENIFSALVRPGNKFKIGTIFKIGLFDIEVVGINETGRILKIQGGSISEFLSVHGALPLPPYIAYSKEKEDDYQTTFAKKEWSVAAPTASLHFTRELLEKIQNPKEYLTLHVWLGTFKGIQTQDIRDYAIHGEKIEISVEIFEKIANIKTTGKWITAVGTTATRTLESLPYFWKSLDQEYKKSFNAKICEYWDTISEEIEKTHWIHNIIKNHQENTFEFETTIYITPGYIFRIVDDLITNFHLSESSLLVLVSAFLWYNETMKIYQKALLHQYRFYSFWDGMYIRWKS